MKIIGIVQARMGSTRLPGKVLLDIEGAPMLLHIINRLRKATTLDDVVLSIPKDDAPLRHFAVEHQISFCTGSEYDLIDRLLRTTELFKADAMVRITGDCPMVDPSLVDEIVTAYKNTDCDYVSNVRPPTFPDGLDVEVYTLKCLQHLDETESDEQRREWPAVCAWDSEEIKEANYTCKDNLMHLRWTVDYQEDLDFVREVYAALRDAFVMDDVLQLLEERPELNKMNAQYARNEGMPVELQWKKANE